MLTPRQELLAQGAHEVLNPLANVLGFAHLLNRLATNRPSDWSPESRTSIAMLVGESERLKTVTEAFLELMRLQDGLFELSVSEVEIDGLVHEEVRAFGRRWPDARLTEDFATTAPTVRTDDVRLRFVLRTVMDFAARSGGRNGSVRVRPASGGATVAVYLPVVEANVESLLISGDADEPSGGLEADEPAEVDLPTRAMQLIARRLGMSITLARRAGQAGAEVVMSVPALPGPRAGVPSRG